MGLGNEAVVWKLEGQLSQGLRKEVVVLNNEGSTRDPDTLETWADAIGADPPTLVNVPPVDLALYNFPEDAARNPKAKGFGGRYVSEFARVAGRLPGCAARWHDRAGISLAGSG